MMNFKRIINLLSMSILATILFSCKDSTEVPAKDVLAGGSAAFSASVICQGNSSGGVTGTAICQSGTTGSEAIASEIPLGKEVWSSSGVLVTGTMPVAKSLMDFHPSGVFREVATAQINLAEEKSTPGALPVGFRNVPVVSKDDDGFFDNVVSGCTGGGGDGDTCTPIIKAVRPAVDCGNTGGMSIRIADCLTLNGANASWSGEINGGGGESTWKLVSRINAKETWVDTATGLLWSDSLGGDNWCDASGNLENFGSINCAVTGGESYCAELDNTGAGLNPAIASEDTTNAFNGTYADEKGGMGLQTGTIVNWRLPTRNDWLQAEIHGIRHVLPNMNNGFWSASVVSLSRSNAWYFFGLTGSVLGTIRPNSSTVRCVGRSAWE